MKTMRWTSCSLLAMSRRLQLPACLSTSLLLQTLQERQNRNRFSSRFTTRRARKGRTGGSASGWRGRTFAPCFTHSKKRPMSSMMSVSIETTTGRIGMAALRSGCVLPQVGFCSGQSARQTTATRHQRMRGTTKEAATQRKASPHTLTRAREIVLELASLSLSIKPRGMVPIAATTTAT